MKNIITVSGKDIVKINVFYYIFGKFPSLIEQVELKVNEHVFICKKGLTEHAQLGNIRTR